MERQPVRAGLRVEDVRAAIGFYAGLGFEEVGSIPNPDGEPVLAILRHGRVHVIVDALVGLPFPDSERERQIQRGPRGLGGSSPTRSPRWSRRTGCPRSRRAGFGDAA